MKKALIDPREINIKYISSWVGTAPNYVAVYSSYPNSARVCQVEPIGQDFSVGEPLFWTDCDDAVVADQWYYNTDTLQIIKIVDASKPVSGNQPNTNGTVSA